MALAALPLPVEEAAETPLGMLRNPPPAVAVASAAVPRELVRMKLLMHLSRHSRYALLPAADPSPWSQSATQLVVWFTCTAPG